MGTAQGGLFRGRRESRNPSGVSLPIYRGSPVAGVKSTTGPPRVKLIATTFTIIRLDQTLETAEKREILLPLKPGYDLLMSTLKAMLPGADPEHVNVFWENKYTDMFVDDVGKLKELPRNEQATAIYRNNWMVHRQGVEPESM